MATAKIGTFSSSGTTFSIATGAPATFDAVGLAAQTFVAIGKVKNGGEFGKQFEIISSNYLSQRGTEKRKGTFNAGTLSLTVDVNNDLGQIACETALDSDADFTFKVVLKNGDTHYMRGIVTSFRVTIGGPNDMTSASIGLDLNPIFLAGGIEVASVKVLGV